MPAEAAHPTRRVTLAVALIVKNEAQNLAACLDSVAGWVDEIVILDSGSTDATEQIARRYTQAFYSSTDWPGFGPQRQRAQTHVTADWILWLDADERVTPELRASIEAVLQNPPDNTIYQVARLSWAFGQFIRHCGWYPGHVERLHPRTLTQYDNALVHESLVLPPGAKLETLQGDLLHYTYATVDEHLRKSAGYAIAWAEQREAAGKKGSLATATLHAVARFFRTYFLRLGILDGRAGFLLSVMAAQSVFNKYACLWSRTRQARPPG
jgi:(heptosyl)LPS beta-1,4-glucosyltransferase